MLVFVFFLLKILYMWRNVNFFIFPSVTLNVCSGIFVIGIVLCL